MKKLHVQLQPQRSRELDAAEAVRHLIDAGEPFAASSHVTEGFDDVAFVNVDFTTSDVVGLWTALRNALPSIRGLAETAIVCCEGAEGWDDYLLLHHFDASVSLDELSPATPGAEVPPRSTERFLNDVP